MTAAYDYSQGARASASDPVSHFSPVDTSAADVDLPFVTTAIHVSGAGDVAFLSAGGDTLTMTLAAGWHPIRLVKILKTGTTATGITACR